MAILSKYISGLVAALAALLCPITPLIITATLFIAVDFVTGIYASYVAAKKSGEEFRIESRKAWRTIYKLCFVLTGIVMTWLIDCCVLGFMELNLANLFTGFVCGVELWSFIENASIISQSKLFVWLGRWLRGKLRKEVGDE
ncbi:MAG: phage holin family protein [Alistipes sp.]|nr:phage holin family protein [Alistipes sp.]